MRTPTVLPYRLNDPGRALTPGDKRVALLYLSGMRPDGIAAYLSCTGRAIQKVLEKPTVQEYLKVMDATFVGDLRPTAERVNKKIEEYSMRALDVVKEVMEDMHAREEIRAKQVALSSAQDILDRAGHRPTQRVEQKNLNAYAVSEATLDKISEVSKELQAIRGE